MKNSILAACAFFASIGLTYGQLTVTNNSDAADLVNTLLGSGITSVSGQTLLGNAGDFTGGDTVAFTSNDGSITMKNGIVLSTGNPEDIDDSNSLPNTQGTAAAGVGSSFGGTEGSSLSFSFQVANDSDLFFNYVFASEEYNEFVNAGFNDGFKLLLSGGVYASTNLAIVPGTGTTPVEIDLVNNGSNSTFYNDNETGVDPFEMDGYTDVFTATASLLAGITYTMEFVVFDRGDTILDSAVFIQAGSFSDTEGDPEIPEPSTVGLLGLAGLAGFTLYRRRKAAKKA